MTSGSQIISIRLVDVFGPFTNPKNITINSSRPLPDTEKAVLGIDSSLKRISKKAWRRTIKVTNMASFT